MGYEGMPRVVIGIDFGTTFSGVAWALENRLDDVEVIQMWPGDTSQKVPTVFDYCKGKIRWGYQVDDTSKSIKGIKLLLDESQIYRYGPSKEASNLLQTMKKSPISAALQTINIQFILTVPAVWSDKAKDATMQAACLAGIPNQDLFLVSEPEAAAVYAIQSIQPNTISEGDCVIVCDAGGGTVNLITYRVNKTEPLRLSEITEGTGAICGSVVLDERFEEFLTIRIGKERYNQLPRTSKAFALKYWQDYVKPNYQGPLDTDDFADVGYCIPIPGIPDIPNVNVANGVLYMDSNDVESIFRPVLRHIEELVTDQRLKAKQTGNSTKVCSPSSSVTQSLILTENYQAIVLVGGLGASEYLCKRLQKASQGVQVMQPQNAGAVHRGLEGNQVDNRKARCHYGTKCRRPYSPKFHSQEKAVWCKLEESWKVENQMSWYIHQVCHSQVRRFNCRGTAHKIDFYRVVDNFHNLKFTDTLSFCLAEEAPEASNATVSNLCELETDLSRVPKELFEKRQNSNGKVSDSHVRIVALRSGIQRNILWNCQIKILDISVTNLLAHIARSE
ncbi:uncharacterized protein N7496_012743 [Penicillium cataractarum]|uniref:Actin-like ATPase domain-containing protein n=1 Tax=Penicillium cataractarum TaxID=2100454 RepID=A0A9W9R8F8_9EURO|nr:uncharacterized protein N7496_012743 [Penicillium cataractarum]KAJ5355531.1 hypothetical protein N7496_012743 [Penicillium cataractarum]